MEKLKWSITGVLLLTLVFLIVFRKNNSENTSVRTAEIEVDYVHSVKNKTQKLFIEKGKYTLELSQLQRITGRASGWHLLFSKQLEEKRLFLLLDFADTTGLFSNDKPVFFHSLEHVPRLPVASVKLFRQKIQLGYSWQRQKSLTNELTLPLDKFVCNFKQINISGNTASMQISVVATHENLLSDLFAPQYVLKANINLRNVPIQIREI